jgi:hypothetical protein
MTIVRHVNFNDYAFAFCGGTCGSFIKLIWNYYICYINKEFNRQKLIVNRQTGDAHNGLSLNYHYTGDVVDIKNESPNKKIVLIIFDDDDIDLITRMQYFKFNKKWLEQNLEYAMNEWPAIKQGLADPATRQETWQQHYIENCKNWKKNIKVDQADFVIDFKTIYYGSDKNLNQIIAEYFETDTLSNVDTFINEYRLINYSLYGK